MSKFCITDGTAIWGLGDTAEDAWADLEDAWAGLEASWADLGASANASYRDNFSCNACTDELASEVTQRGGAISWGKLPDGTLCTDEQEEAATEIAALASNFGTVKYRGRAITLTEHAQMCNFGTDGGVRYQASGVAQNRLFVVVYWDTTATWDEAQDARAYGTDVVLDEEDACDWTTPVRVTLADGCDVQW